MKISEIEKKPVADLQRMLQEKREELRQFYFDLSSGKVKNIRKVRQDRKDIAKILTLINQKKHA